MRTTHFQRISKRLVLVQIRIHKHCEQIFQGRKHSVIEKSVKRKAKEVDSRLLKAHVETFEIIRVLETRFGRPNLIPLDELNRLRNTLRPANPLPDICLFANSIKISVATV
ncbi:hypothetical protein EVAR_49396_1 [Eumeta japonica]|uniref:Uncharacterized protein n=1 Tax=Eumeta variegata TaxID=151549 RepID=A0A4C1YRY3_EUMVA|nr:hypothetical protein EVAR_49396_1 [Eumeta japonica]